MTRNNSSEFSIFFDDGGVMNDTILRGIQWQKMIGDFFSPKYGGESHKWSEANFEFINEIMAEYTEAAENEELIEYNDYYSDFILRWVTSMFEYVGVKVPPEEMHNKIYFEVIEAITPNTKASFPGVVEAIKNLHSQGFRLFTASGEHSVELKGYLRGMRVKDCFENFYGPDLVNTHKTNEVFYDNLFKDIKLDPRRAIIIDDNPKFLDSAEKTGANVIQACLTGEHEPTYRYVIENMNSLPEVIEKLVKKVKK